MINLSKNKNHLLRGEKIQFQFLQPDFAICILEADFFSFILTYEKDSFLVPFLYRIPLLHCFDHLFHVKLPSHPWFPDVSTERASTLPLFT